MNFEIQWNDETYYQTHAGNQYQACIQVLQDYIEEHDTLPISPFYVTNLSVGYEGELIGLADILAIINTSAELKDICDVT